MRYPLAKTHYRAALKHFGLTQGHREGGHTKCKKRPYRKFRDPQPRQSMRKTSDRTATKGVPKGSLGAC